MKITIITNYLDGKLITDIQSASENAYNTNVSNSIKNMNDNIDTKTKLIYDQVSGEINTNIIPKIYSDASNAFLPANTNALKINNNAPMLSKNTLICDDINNITTCTCLFDKCDQLNSLPHYILIDRPLGFSDQGSGITLSGKAIPVKISADNMRLTDTFSLTFFINVTNTTPHDRIFFNWAGDENVLSHYPALIVRGNAETDYGGKYRNTLDIRFSNLGNDGIFNVTSSSRDNCVTIPLYTWTHITILANKRTIKIYINGQLQQQIISPLDIRIGDQNHLITLGRAASETRYSNPSGILLAKMKWYSDIIPDLYIPIFANEYINK
jgi:hypothetical protein